MLLAIYMYVVALRRLAFRVLRGSAGSAEADMERVPSRVSVIQQ
jgi:hypothetical protein